MIRIAHKAAFFFRYALEDLSRVSTSPAKRVDRMERAERVNRSPKGNMWSAIPVALLCLVVNQSERKQGSGPIGDKVL